MGGLWLSCATADASPGADSVLTLAVLKHAVLEGLPAAGGMQQWQQEWQWLRLVLPVVEGEGADAEGVALQLMNDAASGRWVSVGPGWCWVG